MTGAPSVLPLTNGIAEADELVELALGAFGVGETWKPRGMRFLFMALRAKGAIYLLLLRSACIRSPSAWGRITLKPGTLRKG